MNETILREMRESDLPALYVPVRPLYAAAAADNAASRRVLERAGFKEVEQARGFAQARRAEIDEAVFRLD